MSKEIEKIREFLQEKQRELIVSLSNLNDVEKTVSRLRNELHEEYMTIDNRLNNKKLADKDNNNG